MTDSLMSGLKVDRVSDLPYGQVGTSTYDIEQQSWTFARKFSYNYGIQPVDSSRQCLPPSLPRVSSAPAPSHKVQNNALSKRFPEVIPAAFITSELEKTAPNGASSNKEAFSTSSTLIGVGKARDALDRGADATTDIVALASGKAGEVLRLIRPQIDTLGWFGHGGLHIEVMDPGTAIEECYWAGNGGTIRQISFAVEKEGSSKWLASSSTSLAIRQINSTTIFRPIRRRELVPAIVPSDSAFKYPPSRLTSNPIATLSTSKTGGFPHADVTFNPFYVRQLAIVDQGGSWSVWDMDGQEQKSSFKIERSKYGHIRDGLDPNAKPDIADGWGRILWAGDVNTLVVCGRCHLAVFNIEAQPIRLNIPDIFMSMSSGWILDVKQNVGQLNHLFVLTSARIFWLEISSDGENEDAGDVKILFSCRHFRGEDGENMKLGVMSEESSCTLLLYSGTNALINTYRLSANPIPECMHSSFVCKNIPEADIEANSRLSQTQSISIIASEYAGPDLENGTMTSPGSKYLENDIFFYQLFTLSIDLELTVTLCSTTFPLQDNSTPGSMKYEVITVPTVKEVKRNNRQPRFTLEADPFVVPDDLDYDSNSSIEGKKALLTRDGHKLQHFKGRGQRRPYALDYRPVFEQLFHNAAGRHDNAALSQETGFEKTLPQRIENWKDQEKNSLATLFEFVDSISFSEDIDDVAATFNDLLASLPEDGDSGSEKTLTVSQLNGTDSSLLTGLVGNGPDVMAVYNYLIEIWITCLPRKTPGSIRLMKERLIRKVAAELSLSSIAVSMREPEPPKPDDVLESDGMALDRSTPFSSSQLEPIAESSQSRARSRSSTRDPGLLTPAYTPSLASEGSTYGESSEDPAIALLRTYADFRPQQANGPTQAKILSHWTPGSDPAQYSWEATRRANAPSGDEDDDNRFSQRERLRRKKKAEKLNARYKRAGTTDSASQPPFILSSQPSRATSRAPSQPSMPMNYGSQPSFAPYNTVSSQITVNMPMTQVEEGQYGGRQSFKKKAKKRKQGF